MRIHLPGRGKGEKEAMDPLSRSVAVTFFELISTHRKLTECSLTLFFISYL